MTATSQRKSSTATKSKPAQNGRSTVDADIVENYADIVNEVRALIAVSVFNFGFLLTVARSDLTTAEQWLLFGAITSVASATWIFVLPILYHRVQFPYTDWEKYHLRTHAFLLTGLPLLGIGFYLSLVLARWPQFDYAALVIALVPLVAALAVMISRRTLTTHPNQGR